MNWYKRIDIQGFNGIKKIPKKHIRREAMVTAKKSLNSYIINKAQTKV